MNTADLQRLLEEKRVIHLLCTLMGSIMLRKGKYKMYSSCEGAEVVSWFGPGVKYNRAESNVY